MAMDSKEQGDWIVVCIMIATIAAFIGALISVDVTNTKWKKKVAQTECGTYSSKTGEFEIRNKVKE